jgi:hypothetical protein
MKHLLISRRVMRLAQLGTGALLRRFHGGGTPLASLGPIGGATAVGLPGTRPAVRRQRIGVGRASAPRGMLVTLALCAAFALAACGGGDDAEPRRIDISFGTAGNDWTLGSSDYSVGTAPDDLALGLIDLPAPYRGQALRASGGNRSANLWLYVKKRYAGLAPGRAYDARVSLTILAQVPQGCVGVGGAPGESVFVKGGVAGIEPATERVGDEFLMNIDKGNQSTGGSVGVLLGDLTNSGTGCQTVPAEAKTMAGPSPIRVRADADGAVWVFFGIDSGFESGSSLTLMSASVELEPV